MSVFTQFDFDNDVVENQKVKVSSGIFSGGTGTLTAFYTASAQTATGSFYSVYHQDPDDASFSAIAYAPDIPSSGFVLLNISSITINDNSSFLVSSSFLI